MFDFKIGDKVRIIGERETGTIENMIENVAIVKYADGRKRKTGIVNLLPPLDDKSITITPEKYDEAVKALMYAAAEDAGDTDKLDSMLEVIGTVCSELKARLFNGQD